MPALTRNRFGGQVVCEDRTLLIEEAGHAYKNPVEVAEDLEAFEPARRVVAMTPLLTYKTGDVS